MSTKTFCCAMDVVMFVILAFLLIPHDAGWLGIIIFAYINGLLTGEAES